MKKLFHINVTNVVNKVKEQNLLFYPVIIYIFVKALLKNGHQNIKPAYINTNQNGVFSILSQEFTDDFEIFFQDYIRNCFYNQKTTTTLQEHILFSYISPNQLNLAGKNLPVLYILPLEQKDNKTYLSFCAINIDIEDTFTSVCQELCALF